MGKETMNSKPNQVESFQETGSPPETMPGDDFSQEMLRRTVEEREDAADYLEQLISTRKVPRYRVLDLLSEHYGVAFIEYDEMLLLAVRVERKLGSSKRAGAYAQALRKRFPDAPEVQAINKI